MKKVQKKGSHIGLSNFLKKFPIYRLKFHCFETDLPDCMLALSSRKSLKILDLTLTNKTNNPSVEDILKSDIYTPLFAQYENDNIDNTVDYNNDKEDTENNYNQSKIKTTQQNQLFPDLKELILDSSHIQHVNLAGRAKLLDILGSNLESLTFAGLSPKGNLHIYI